MCRPHVQHRRRQRGAGGAAAWHRQQVSIQSAYTPLCKCVDLKSNIADVNVALAELQRGIDNRSAYSQHTVSIQSAAPTNGQVTCGPAYTPLRCAPYVPYAPYAHPIIWSTYNKKCLPYSYNRLCQCVVTHPKVYTQVPVR
jgi:hypothetical protein